MYIDINTRNMDESNEFLRCLWGEIRKEFGKSSWYYMPIKKGDIIEFGCLDIGCEFPLNVGIVRLKEGGIEKIFFLEKGKNIQRGSELCHRLQNAINKAKNNLGIYNLYSTKQYLTNSLGIPLAGYKGKNFEIQPTRNGNNMCTLGVEAYDDNQATGYIVKKTRALLDFLSVETNAFFRTTNEPSDAYKVESEVYQNPDFMDGYPLSNNHLVISVEGKKIIDQFFGLEQKDNDLAIFFNACKHFHSARKLDCTWQIFIDEDNRTEIALSLYLSALEVVTLIDFKDERCNECGQTKYKISERIKNLVAKYLSEERSKAFARYYDLRSKYLHRGIKLISDSPTPYSVPLLDKKGENGMTNMNKLPIYNIPEWVSFCLRKFYRERLVG